MHERSICQMAADQSNSAELKFYDSNLSNSGKLAMHN